MLKVLAWMYLGAALLTFLPHLDEKLHVSSPAAIFFAHPVRALGESLLAGIIAPLNIPLFIIVMLKRIPRIVRVYWLNYKRSH